MADSIVRLKVDSSEYDNKIKRAAQGLQQLGTSLHQAGKSFVDADKDQIEFVKQLGKMETVTKTAKGSLGEMTQSFTNLRMQYKQMTDAEKQSPFGKALNQSLNELKGRIKETQQHLHEINEELSDMGKNSGGGGGLFSGLGGNMSGALQVFTGNMMTKAAGAVASLGLEMADTIKQGIELARQGEGVRNAFERLNRPDLLDNLKEATHGTVSELELMKAAVKFDDFKLPVEQLGTLLAFAQKKAKDTGQSVDYMVDSIVTGLGRKSLMILDNLGLSAAQVKERMKESGDMTKAVADIIKEQMAEAGEYVETAADRAARAAADATNQMERLGREAQPFAEEWANVWNELKIGGMSVLTTVLGPIADSIRSIREILSGEFELKIKANIPNLANGPQSPWDGLKPGTDHTVQAPGGYVEVTDKNTGAVIGGQHFDNLNDANAIKDWQKSLIKTTTTKSSKNENYAADSIAYQEKLVQELTKKWREASAAVRDDYARQLGEAKQTLSEMNGGFSAEKLQPIQDLVGRVDNRPGTGLTQGTELTLPAKLEIKSPVEQWKEQITSLQEAMNSAWSTDAIIAYQSEIDTLQKKIKKFTGKIDGESMAKDWQSAANAIGQVGSAMQQIEDPAAKVMGIIAQAIATMALSYAQAASSPAVTGTGWGWIAFAATGLATMVSSIAAIKSATAGSYAEGGIIPGNHYSGDQQWAQVNAGELILNRSQQNSIAAQLQDTERGGGYTPSHISGEQIYVVLNRYTRRTGKGEIVTWRN